VKLETGQPMGAGLFAAWLAPLLLPACLWLSPASANGDAGDEVPSTASLTRGSTTPGQAVTIETPHRTVAEGTQATFRFRRSDTAGRLAVDVELDGTATHGEDYSMEGFAAFMEGRGSVVFAEGQGVVVIAVDVADDIMAEAIESIGLRIAGGDELSLRAALLIAANDTVVTTTADRGEGSFRQALQNSVRLKGPDTITFDSLVGPFAEPQTIQLESPLPPLSGEVVIDGFIPDRLWQASGVTLSAGGEHRVFEIAENANVILRSFTIADGRADTGGGLLNRGNLVVEGMLLLNNSAATAGGGLANAGGSVRVINTTFSANSAAEQGGGMANVTGSAVVTNSTFTENASPAGAGLFSAGALRLSNSILAGNEGPSDCVSIGLWDLASSGNLIAASDGCKGVVTTEDPRFGVFGRYNGPTMIYPLNGDSPAINSGENGEAVDHEGRPLVWDQRGNGDPRFVSGITDIGAFEHQRHAWFEVDTLEDSGARSCTRIRMADCSLRGAITLANADGKAVVIRFDEGVFGEDEALIALREPLPVIRVDMTIDGISAGGVGITAAGDAPLFRCLPGIRLETPGVNAASGEERPVCAPAPE
jgi:hypothetical protein